MSSFVKNQRAFTLIELLIAVLIVGVLLALLFPVMNRARGVAKNTGCVNNLRQLGAVMTLYAGDHGGVFPQNERDDEAGYCWDVQIRDYVGITSDVGANAAASGQGSNILHCPAGKLYTKYKGISRGYAYNLYVAKPVWGMGRPTSVPDRSRLWLLMEIYISSTWSPSYEESEHYYGGAGYSNCEEVSRTTVWTTVKPGLVYRHDSRMNILFADGHVGSTTKNPSSTFPKGIVWYWNNNGTAVAD